MKKEEETGHRGKRFAQGHQLVNSKWRHRLWSPTSRTQICALKSDRAHRMRMARTRGVSHGLCHLLTGDLDKSLGLPRSHCHPLRKGDNSYPAKVILTLAPGTRPPTGEQCRLEAAAKEGAVNFLEKSGSISSTEAAPTRSLNLGALPWSWFRVQCSLYF